VRIGLDFDNTIAGYDRVFVAAARHLGHDFPEDASKRAIRDRLRASAGDEAWMRLQGLVYGRLMHKAEMIAGVAAFLRKAREQGARVMIVSHKTEFGHFDPDRVPLRTAAMDWMVAQGFFGEMGFGLAPEDVFFEGTRAEKVARIASLGLDVFVDDLEEVFLEPSFPEHVARVLYAPERQAPGPFVTCRSWDDVAHHVFHAA
jgi:hypothetical protein